LRLDVPLAQARATQVQGSVTLANADLSLGPSLPSFARASGRVEFTERGFKLAGVTSGFLGGQILLDGGTRADGSIAIAGSGTATPVGVRRLVDLAFVQRLLDRAEGTARYAGSLAVRDGRTELRLESDLVGWSIAAPEPLGKAAAEALPARFEILPTDARSDRVRFALGDRLALQFARSGPPGAMRVERGAIRIGSGTEADSALPQSGVRAVVNLPRLNVDRWSPLFSGIGRDAAAASGAASALPDLIAARIGELVIAGKPIANLVLGATRTPAGDDTVWLANVVSDNATGSVTWQMPRGDSPGRVSSRLTRLAIAEGSRTEIADVLDAPPTDVPAFDVVVDSFELGARKFGRLELVAHNTGAGDGAAWELQRLEISNPDARMHATGRWAREPGATARTMALDLALEFGDAGKLLTRLGIADAVRGGEGTLSGRVSWRGAPLAIDYPTLAGHLKLAANNGQFLKADAGAGRLLGVLSLQALPRRLTLDFRDVFSEGFAFDAITASADIAGGVLTTRDFKMRGANATVLMEGSTDLRAETQNLHVLVLPEVNVTSASLVYALLANPAIGLGTFLAQLLLREPLAKAFSFEYDITGSWQDPQVKRRERPPTDTGELSPELR
ncbi:MAG TPA: AsmA-like C-terminal region-containing protein, partial [Burkholderiaceae bacterium]|nr:AsmA-like C-terminal region-containing protein [Burkholderiaceae bacterium]